MKAWITSNGQLTIQPETETQAYALRMWLRKRSEPAQTFPPTDKVIAGDKIFVEALEGKEAE